MQEFTQAVDGYTCAKCGKALKVGSKVFALHNDAFRSGASLCSKCAKDADQESATDTKQTEEDATDLEK